MVKTLKFIEGSFKAAPEKIIEDTPEKGTKFSYSLTSNKGYKYKGKYKLNTGKGNTGEYHFEEIPEEKVGIYSKDKYWLHRETGLGQLTTKNHPFDITNTRNRKFPKIKRF